MSGGFLRDETTLEEIEREAAVVGPLASAVRDLVDATIRTTVEDDDVREVTAEVERLAARLRASQLDGSYGVRLGGPTRGRAWGNAVVGLRNAVAPPLVVQHHEARDGRVWSDFHLGAAYEGPPGLVHGGVCALVLDQVLGESAGASGRPGMTGTLTLRYRQGTPLGDLRTEGRITHVDGIKTYASGELIGPDGVTVEAEGVFILPRWARDRVEDRPPFFE